MLHVHAIPKPSTHGLGLFAVRAIPKGTVVWRFSKEVDKAYTKEEAEMLSEPERSAVLSLFHAYMSKQTGKYILPGDDARHINHSENPNIGVRYEDGVEEDINFALRDISPGEELTLDYNDFAKEGVDFEV